MDVEHRKEGAITRTLRAWRADERGATADLVSLVYEELRRLADRSLNSERKGHTLSATGLVHETYLRLLEQKRVDWKSRRHFFALAARMMRRILVDHARERQRLKRGGRLHRVPLEEVTVMATERPPELLAVDQALTELARFDPFKEAIVELRFFAGFTVRETAEILEVSQPTVIRHWRTARAWLYRTIYCAPTDADESSEV